jgi:hypothetical protein
VGISEEWTANKIQEEQHLPAHNAITTEQEGPSLLDDEWEKNEGGQPPDRGDESNRRQFYFYVDGNIEWIVAWMVKRRTLKLSKKIQ